MKNVIEIERLKKVYGKQTVLNLKNINFIKGQSYLLIGANGSGKSTLIKLLLGLIKPTEGKFWANIEEIGYMPEKVILPEFITVKKFLINLCKIRKMTDEQINRRIQEYLNLFKVDGNKRIKTLSKGMLQKVSLIQALIHTPKLYIFDEPLNGLDVESQKQFIKIIKCLILHKKTVIITTHFEKYYHGVCANKLVISEGLIHERITKVSS